MTWNVGKGGKELRQPQHNVSPYLKRTKKPVVSLSVCVYFLSLFFSTEKCFAREEWENRKFLACALLLHSWDPGWPFFICLTYCGILRPKTYSISRPPQDLWLFHNLPRTECLCSILMGTKVQNKLDKRWTLFAQQLILWRFAYVLTFWNRKLLL